MHGDLQHSSANDAPLLAEAAVALLLRAGAAPKRCVGRSVCLEVLLAR